jgi:flagellar motor switch protein FliM
VEILSQSEIEALLASLTGDDEPSSAPAETAAPAAMPSFGSPRSESKTVSYEPYDFRRPDKLSKDQMRTLQMIHETFGRVFASTLTAYLRCSTHIDLISVEQTPYEEYTRSLASSLIAVYGMPPLAGNALLEMEFTVLLAMIDRLLGGPGNMNKASFVLTEIEQALAESIINRACKDLKSSWEGIATITPRPERMETQAQFVQIVPPNDIVISILYEVKVGDLRGAMSICLPYMLLKPISAKLSAQHWFSTSAKKSLGRDARTIAGQLERVKVNCRCRLGTARLSVGDLVNLSAGDTVVLDKRADEEVELVIGNQIKFYGRAGNAGRRVAMHINRQNTDSISI